MVAIGPGTENPVDKNLEIIGLGDANIQIVKHGICLDINADAKRTSLENSGTLGGLLQKATIEVKVYPCIIAPG